MKKSIFWVVLLAALAAVAALFFFPQEEVIDTRAPVGLADQPPPGAPAEPAIRYPLPSAPGVIELNGQVQGADQEKPLPALNESDGMIREMLAKLFDPQKLDQLFIVKNFIQRFAVTIDNLPRGSLPTKHLPTKAPAGTFVTSGDKGAEFISPDNYRRYAPYVSFAEAVDTSQLVAAYVHLYPLFQQAYKELGYPSGYFNDRLIEVLDHLLETPEVPEPVRLVRPSVLYQYANPALESLSSGQKLLIRIGNDNANRIKAKLREIREELASRVENR